MAMWSTLAKFWQKSLLEDEASVTESEIMQQLEEQKQQEWENQQVPRRYIFDVIKIVEALGKPPQLSAVTNALGECYLREYSDRAIYLKAWFFADSTKPYLINGYDSIKIFTRDWALDLEELVFEWQAFIQPEILHYQHGTWEDYLSEMLLRRAEQNQ